MAPRLIFTRIALVVVEEEEEEEEETCNRIISRTTFQSKELY